MRIERRILLGRMETGTGGWDDPANKAYWRRQMGRRAMSDVRPASHSRRVSSQGCYRGARQGGRWGGATYILYLWNLIYRSTPCSAWPTALGWCAPRWVTRYGRRLMLSPWSARQPALPRARRATSRTLMLRHGPQLQLIGLRTTTRSCDKRFLARGFS